MNQSREERNKNRSQKRRLVFLEEQNEILEKRVASLQQEIAASGKAVKIEAARGKAVKIEAARGKAVNLPVEAVRGRVLDAWPTASNVLNQHLISNDTIGEAKRLANIERARNGIRCIDVPEGLLAKGVTRESQSDVSKFLYDVDRYC
jgi:hypothetical protein